MVTRIFFGRTRDMGASRTMTDPLVRGVYRPQLHYMPWLILVVVGAPIFGIVVTWPELRAGIGPQDVFLAVWWVGIAWVLSVLLRVATHLEVTDSELRWRTPLRRGTTPLRALHRARTIILIWAVVIDADDGTRVWLLAQPATSQLLDHLRVLAPQLQVGSLSWHWIGWRMHRYTRADAR
jgi:hypothetical protein